jgi:6-phospho-beta-glucosidase
MKVTVVGGGSTYTPELIQGFIHLANSFPITELCLMDIDEERLSIVGGFAQRMVASKDLPFTVTLSTNRRQAISSASYVITQLRVGMMPARRNDEYLGHRHGLVGQETTGVGGMAKALRTIPVILEIARDIYETAPGAILANFTNPAGLVTEALFRYAPEIISIGVCNSGITTKMGILESLEKKLGQRINPQDAVLHTLGLNHLTWYRGFTLKDEDLWETVFSEFLSSLRQDPEPYWDIKTIETLGMIPNSYLSYFYYTDKKLADQKKWPPSRAESVQQIERDLIRLYSDPSLTAPPPDLMKRGGAYYSTLATELINAHFNDLGQIHIVNTRNGQAVKEWPADWVVEIPSKVSANGIDPLKADPLPLVCSSLVAQVKAYEILTVEAAVHGDRKSAYQALLAHPLGPNADRVQAVLDDMLEVNKPYLPRFWS